MVGSSRMSRSGRPEHGLGDGEPLPHALRVGAHRAVQRVAEPGDLQGLVEVGVLGGRPVACQYSSRLARPDRCGRKPGALDEGADPGQHRRARPDRRGRRRGSRRRRGVMRPISMRRVVVLPGAVRARAGRAPGPSRRGRTGRGPRTGRRTWRTLGQAGDLQGDVGAGPGPGAGRRRAAAGGEQQRGGDQRERRERQPPDPPRAARPARSSAPGAVGTVSARRRAATVYVAGAAGEA